MQIRVTVVEAGDSAIVDVVNPTEDGLVVATRQINGGQQIVLTLPDVHDADGIEIGEVEAV